MIYLTDQPEQTEKMLPVGGAWQAATFEQLSASDQQLWQLLGTAGDIWLHVETEHQDAERQEWRTVLIDSARTSQFDAVIGALKSGTTLPNKLVCLALSGTNFRGQRDRPWVALRGNLHLTVHYRLNADAKDVQTGLTLLPAVATAHTISDISNGRLNPKVKWVNDVLIVGHKVAGVLTSTHVDGDQISNVVFGIGMNLAQQPEIVPSSIVRQVGALAQFDPDLKNALPTALERLVHHLDVGLQGLINDGPAPLFNVYKSMATFIGKDVRIWPEHRQENSGSEPIATGQVLDLLPDLSLVIDGQKQPIHKGRMELLETNG